MKTILEVSLVSLTIGHALFLKMFEKMQAIPLHWLAAQQETGAITQQKSGIFYAKFSAEFNESSFFF